MKLRIDLISMWEAGMIFQGSSGAVGQPAGRMRSGGGGVLGPRRGMRFTGQNALQGLFACQPHSLTCVQRVTESGPSPYATAFFRPTGWFLTARHQKHSSSDRDHRDPGGLTRTVR